MIRSSPWSTSGSQKCSGASPIFNAKAIVVSVAEVGFSSSVRFHWPVVQAFVTLANSNRADAEAWVMKYFVVASTARGWCW